MEKYPANCELRKHWTAEQIFKNQDFPLSVLYSRARALVVPHTHEFFELVLIIGGYALHGNRIGCIPLMQGDLIAVNCGDEHSYSHAENLLMINVMFAPSFIEDVWTQISNMPAWKLLLEEKDKLYMPLKTFQAAESLAAKLEKEIARKEDGFVIASKSILAELLIHIGRAPLESKAQAPNREPENRRSISKALLYMEKYYRRKIRLEELAEKAQMSRAGFCRHFKTATGLAPLSYLNNLRFERAKFLLKTTELSVGDIARESGFDDAVYMARVFSKRESISPLVYRKGFTNLDPSEMYKGVE